MFNPSSSYLLLTSNPSSYRIHLSPGSRRSAARGSARGQTAKKAVIPPPVLAEPPVQVVVPSQPSPPPLSPPPLEQARINFTHDISPPDSPPPLAQATLPATATLSIAPARMDAASDRSSSSSSPQAYSSSSQNALPMSSQSASVSAGQTYSYRNGTTTYQEQSPGTGSAYTYVHTTPLSQQSASASNSSSYSSYPNSANSHNYSNHSLQHHATQSRNSPISVSVSSRHSISHISHPHSSYSQNQSSSAGPASPASSHSVSSHTSGPPTPTYPVFHDDGQSYHSGNTIMAEHPGLHTTHINSQPHILHNQYPPTVQTSGRFDSPPPTLAPIQDERLVRRDMRHSSHHTSPYIHQPQPLPTEYSYHHQALGLGHSTWKGDNNMRRGLGTALV